MRALRIKTVNISPLYFFIFNFSNTSVVQIRSRSTKAVFSSF